MSLEAVIDRMKGNQNEDGMSLGYSILDDN